MSKQKWITELLTPIVGSVQTAEIVVQILSDEGLLNLGYGNNDVDRILQKFTNSFGTTKTTKYDRFSANRLATKYGGQSVCGVIQLLSEHSEAKYAPVVGSVSQLEEKWVSCVNFLRKLNVEIIDA